MGKLLIVFHGFMAVWTQQNSDDLETVKQVGADRNLSY